MLKAPFFIDLDTVKSVGFNNKNVENSLLATVLRRVQDVVLKPVIGRKLYKRLCEGIRNTAANVPGGLNANETILLQDYISHFLIASIDVRSVNALRLELRSKTSGKSHDEYIEPLTESESLMMSDDLRRDREVYRDDLIDYLKKNSDLYPEYENPDCGINGRPDRGAPKTNIRFR